MTYCRTVRDCVQEHGVAVEIVSNFDLDWMGAWRAVRSVDLVHLNSHHLPLALFARLQGKPLVIKYHYPLWDEIHRLEHEPRKLPARVMANLLFNWKISAPDPWSLRLRFVLDRFLRSLLRVTLAGLASKRLACSASVAKAADLPAPIEVEHNLHRFDLPSGEPERAGFLYAGRLHPDKGVDLLLEAAALLKQRGRVFAVAIAGTGQEEERLRERMAALGLQDVVEFVGPLTTADLQRRMLAAACVVVPSRWNDPAPYVILEAAAAACCVIGAERGGIPELLGDAGLLFTCGDIAGLAGHMARVLDQSDEAQRRGEALRDRLQSRCGAQIAAPRLAAMYRSLASRSARVAPGEAPQPAQAEG